jgi:ribonuclease HI
MKKIKIYSDWWASPNPWIWGFWVILEKDWIKKEYYQWYKKSTNNRMELLWVIFWLKQINEKSEIKIYTDSKYIVNWIEKWWAKWWKAKWWKKKSWPVLNIDLWADLLNLIEKNLVKFFWIKWHNWHLENERCDELVWKAKNWKLIDDFDKSEKVKNNAQSSLF